MIQDYLGLFIIIFSIVIVITVIAFDLAPSGTVSESLLYQKQ